MGKILVFYHSNTGNVAAMAELVAEGAAVVDGMEVRLRNLDDVELADLQWCDGIALGSPTNLGSVPWKMKRWWDEVAVVEWANLDGKIGTVFSSAGGWGGGQEIACQGLTAILMNFGFLVFGVTDYAGKQHTLHYGAVVAGEPRSDKEREGCLRLGRRLAEWVAVFVDGNQAAHPLRQDYPRKPSDFS